MKKILILIVIIILVIGGYFLLFQSKNSLEEVNKSSLYIRYLNIAPLATIYKVLSYVPPWYDNSLAHKIAILEFIN